MKQGVPSQAWGRVMTQAAQPVIHGAEWTPSEALTFTQPLLYDAARAEVMRFFAERHEGHVFLAANIWDHLHVDDEEDITGEIADRGVFAGNGFDRDGVDSAHSFCFRCGGRW